MPFDAGSRLGPYEILAPLGAGGMGEVYRARDTRLDRIVAVKVLPESMASDPQFRDRFDREARAISQLDHPNICPLYDVGDQDGTSFLVMQYLEGETLEQRLKKAALSVPEALAIDIQIANALDQAHRAGIVHRDLKPGNVMVTKSGAKLLDFGLAKTVASGPAAGLSMMPTTPANLTVQGAILGTFQYMAPEQLEGQEADARTDIFAFGVVLYEMLTGRKAFEGKTQASLIAGILEREPKSLPDSLAAPPALAWILEKCLKKDPAERWQSARDLSDQLRWVLGGSGTSVGPAITTPSPRRLSGWTMAVAALAAAVVIAASVALGMLWRRETTADLVRFAVTPPPRTTFTRGSGATPWPMLSPDGRRLIFGATNQAGQALLWIRTLDSLTSQPLAGTEGGQQPFWSPDGRNFAFFADGKLKRMDISGGAPQTIGETTLQRRGTWNQDGVILLAARNGAIQRVASAGGQTVAVTTLDQSHGETEHLYPSFLPDGKHFLYTVLSAKAEHTGIYVGSLDSTPPTRLLADNSEARYAPPGYLVFVREFTLMAQPFDARSLATSGEPVAVGEQVSHTLTSGIASFSVSDTGVLAYGLGSGGGGATLQLVWLDRQGKLLEEAGASGNYLGLDLAPDGTRIAAHRHDGQGGDIWLLDWKRGANSRVTFDPSQKNSSPSWSPDGSRLVFASLRSGKWGVYEKRADGAGNERLLLESQNELMPEGWSPDGESILYTTFDSRTRGDLWRLPVTGDRKPDALLTSPFDERFGQISPDGKWLAYASNETNRLEVYVRPFPTGAGKWQVSTNAGSWPVWRRDGHELFYIEARRTGQPGRVEVVEIKSTASTFAQGSPHDLFDSGAVIPTHPSSFKNFAVSSDGQRFLVARLAGNAGAGLNDLPIAVVVNWTAGLKR